MSEIPHDFQLIVDLLIKDTVFHEAALVEFFCSIDGAMLLGRNLVHSSERTLANLSSHVVHGTTGPMHTISIGR